MQRTSFFHNHVNWAIIFESFAFFNLSLYVKSLLIGCMCIAYTQQFSFWFTCMEAFLMRHTAAVLINYIPVE